MKNVIILLNFISIFFMQINQTNAWNLENKLYKQAIISKIQIKKDYWENINSKTVNIFMIYRYLKDKKSLNKLEILLKEKIIKLNTKKVLSKIDRKKLNLYNNMYYRTKLLLDYQFKK